MKGSVVARGSGRWLLRFDGGRDATGRRKQITRTVQGTKKEAQAQLRELISRYDRGELVAERPQSLGDYCAFWMEHHAASLGDRTRQNYTEYIDAYIKPNLGDIPLSKLRPIDLQLFYKKMLTSGRRRSSGGLSVTTVRHMHTLLHTMLRQAVKWEIISVDPTSGATPPKAKTPERRFLTEEDIRRLLTHAKEDPLYMGFLLGVSLGLRRGEIAGLRWTDIDWEQSSLTVRWTRVQIKASAECVKAPKTAAGGRTITIPEVVLHELREQREWQDRMREDVGKVFNPEDYVVVWPDGTLPLVSNFNAHLDECLTAAGLPHVTMHQLRHSSASLLLALGVNIKVISERLGHTSPAMTMRIYSHVAPIMQTEAAEKLNDVFKEKPK